MAVTSFMTQYDELRQLEEFVSGLQRPETPQMTAGTKFHAQLEKTAPNLESLAEGLHFIEHPDGFQLAYGDRELMEPTLDVSKNSMRFVEYLRKIISLVEQLENPRVPALVREVPVYGHTLMDPNFELRGIVDGVQVTRAGIEIVETKTTRRRLSNLNYSLVHLAYHQTLCYHHILDTLLRIGAADPANVMDMFRVDLPVLRESLALDAARFQHAHRILREIGMSNTVQIDIFDRSSEQKSFRSTFDRQVFEEIVNSRTDLFTGKRPPFGFSLRDVFDR